MYAEGFDVLISHANNKGLIGATVHIVLFCLYPSANYQTIKIQLHSKLSAFANDMLTHSLIHVHHFERVQNPKKLQTTTGMWLLKDFKIQIA